VYDSFIRDSPPASHRRTPTPFSTPFGQVDPAEVWAEIDVFCREARLAVLGDGTEATTEFRNDCPAWCARNRPTRVIHEQTEVEW
jgi:hypothetical protein